MLRLRRALPVIVRTRSLCVPGLPTSPSATTTALLRHLPNTVTIEKLTAAVKDINARKVELEPGFICHTIFESDAMYLQKYFSEKSLETKIVSSSIPSLMLSNLAPQVSLESIRNTFSKFNPTRIQLIGTVLAEAHLTSVEDALIFKKSASAISIEGRQLQVETIYISTSNVLVRVFNIPANVSLDAFLGHLKPVIPEALLRQTAFSLLPIAPYSALIRLKGLPRDTESIRKQLESITVDGVHPVVSEEKLLHKPALFLRNLTSVSEDALRTLFADIPGVERVQWSHKSKDIMGDLAVVYFISEETAFSALRRIKGMTLDGAKLTVNFRDAVGPAVRVTRLPADVDEAQLLDLFKDFDVLAVYQQGTEAVVALKESRQVLLAAAATNRKVLGDTHIHVEPHELFDTVFEMSFIGAQVSLATLENKVAEVLAKDSVKALSLTSNVSAFLGFEAIQHVIRRLPRHTPLSHSSPSLYRLSERSLPSSLAQWHWQKML